MQIEFIFFSLIQANITEVEVSIPSKLHNSLIGSKGRFVRSIMEECGGVHIHFPTEGSGDDKVTIRGPAEEVAKAKQQLLALAEEKVCGVPALLSCKKNTITDTQIFFHLSFFLIGL